MKKLVFLAIFALFCVYNINAQFIQLNTGETETLQAITHHNGNIFVGGFNKIIKSSDNGLTWQTVLLLNCGDITKIIFNGSNGLAISIDKLFHSSDNGNSWTIINLPAPLARINDVSFKNTYEAYVLATRLGGYGGLAFKSTTQGVVWETVPFFNSSNYEPTAMCWRNDTAFAILRYFDGITCQNSLAEMASVNFSIQETWPLQSPPLSYGKKIIWDGNNFLILGSNSFGAMVLLQKNQNYERIVPYSSGFDYVPSMIIDEVNHQAIICGQSGLMMKISTIGDISSNAFTLIATGTTAGLFDLDIINGYIYAVGYQGTLITNNTTLNINDNPAKKSAEIICQTFSNGLEVCGNLMGRIQVLAADGKLIFIGEKNSESIRIETNNLPAGIYLLRIGGITKKIIKN